ncbi:MAG: hydrogenase maturation nickel metallochaperone HypA [Anaerolineae bacterium]|nr:hydrogenase maturation nickel metallochaperone HypA [Anaerolineae bacterium]
MHELSVTQNIIDVVCRHAEEAQAKRIVRIHLVIGELSSIVDDSVQFYFDFLSEGTLAEGAELVFQRLSVKVRCEACGHEWEPTSADWTCPLCGQARARVIRGREFYIDSIEVE